MTREVIVAGYGLHTGEPASVAVRAHLPGAVRLRAGDAEAPVAGLAVVATARATTVEGCGGRLRVQTVEHALSALAGLGIHEGVALTVDGPEMPLLDGGAARWCEALDAVCPPVGDAAGRRAPGAAGARLRVTEHAVLSVGPSRYELWPGDGVRVEVCLELDDPRLDPEARWDGDPDDYRARIAPARTFALARDVDELLRRGLARNVDPASVLLVTPDAIHHAGRAPAPDEPARHKLLDLLGDLYLCGGPPIGRVRAHRPGHAANARALRLACERGVLACAQSG